MNEHLDSFEAELNQSQFFRMFALGCFDAFITLPVSLTSVVGSIVQAGSQFRFYQGWAFVHTDWEPQFFSKEYMVNS